MNSETADPAGTQRVALGQTVCPLMSDNGGELVVPLDRSTRGPLVPVGARLARLRADPARMTAVRESWRALWSSRLLVWAAGVGTVVAFGFGPLRKAFNPPGVTRGFGWLGDLLAAPAARWDAAWYLVIAHYGYRPDLGVYTSSRTAFFPLYPLGLRTIAWFGTPPVLAGVLLSVAALAFALYGIHRLTTLELARGAWPSLSGDRVADAARLAVMLTAFAPMAFFFSAVYSESLYLALSVGLFWSARHGRWTWVGVLGALAGATRSTGLVLVLPALMIYLYGPREDRPPDRSGERRARVEPALSAARRRAVAGSAAGGRVSVWRLPGARGREPAGAAACPGRLEQTLRGPLCGLVGRRTGGVRGCSPAAVLPAPAPLLPDR